jgi:hypothetical protein
MSISDLNKQFNKFNSSSLGEELFKMIQGLNLVSSQTTKTGSEEIYSNSNIKVTISFCPNSIPVSAIFNPIF